MKHEDRMVAIMQHKKETIPCEVCGASDVDYIQFPYPIAAGEKTRGYHDKCLEPYLKRKKKHEI